MFCLLVTAQDCARFPPQRQVDGDAGEESAVTEQIIYYCRTRYKSKGMSFIGKTG